MNRFKLFGSLVLFYFVAVSCQAPAAITGPDSLSFASDGAEKAISITVNRDWNISSSESWCTVTPQSGKSSDDPVTVTVRCQPNMSYDGRNAVVTIRTEEISHTIQITQDQRDAIFSDAELLRSDGQSQDLVIAAEANVDFSVTVLKGGDWIRPVEGTKGLVKKDVRIHVDENRSGDVREGAVMLSRDKASSTVRVRQAPLHAVLDKTAPGIYGIGGKDYVYQAGVSQLSRGKKGTVSFFRILDPEPPVALSVEGLPAETTLADAFPLNVRLDIGEEGVVFQSSGTAVVMRESDSLLWLLLPGDKGLIVKK